MAAMLERTSRRFFSFTADGTWLAKTAFLVFFVTSSFMLTTARAADPENRPIVTSINAKQLATVLRNAGFAAEIDEDDEDENTVDLTIEGFHAVAFVWDEGTRIEFYAGFSDQTLTPMSVNAWASSDRLSRTFVSDEGSAGIKADLYLSPGVTRDAIIFYCRAFSVDFETFLDLVVPLTEKANRDGTSPMDDDPFADDDPFGKEDSETDNGDDAMDPFRVPQAGSSVSEESDEIFDDPFEDSVGDP